MDKGEGKCGRYTDEENHLEKASGIFADLLNEAEDDDDDTGEGTSDFRASRSWFKKFKLSPGILSVVWHREAASLDAKAAEDFGKQFAQLILDER